MSPTYRAARLLTILFIANVSANSFDRRADCRTIQVNQGDGCDSLAQRCGISGAAFDQYNPQPGLCGNLKPGQYVCCSSGTLPDRTPKQNSDGSCYVYHVNLNDDCNAIGAAHGGLTVQQIEGFNKQTWG